MFSSQLTCVSAYFRTHNKHGDKFNDWFENTLSINCPYVFFVNKESAEIVKRFRGALPTFYVELELNEFYTFAAKDKMRTHSTHCPSIELNLIWNEKIFMMQRALQLNPFGSEWFKWIDAGICIFLDTPPPPLTIPFPKYPETLNALPKDKFLFSTSTKHFNPHFVQPSNYYHFVSGTSYILHSSMIDEFAAMYKEYFDRLVDGNNIWTDQVIWTHIYKDFPHRFYRVCDGYGELTRFLF